MTWSAVPDHMPADMPHARADEQDVRAAFDELGRLVLSEHSMESVLQKVADLAKAALPGADEVSVTLLREHAPETVVFTNPAAKQLDEGQYVRGYGPCLDAARLNQAMHIADMSTESRWSDYTSMAAAQGWNSSLSQPIQMQRTVGAALNIYSRGVGSFDEDSQQLAATFASYAGVALANMHLYDSTRRLAENLEVAMQSRAVIEQAKGILMRDESCSADEAFTLLVATSQRSNRKLREVAQALVDSARA